MQQAHKSHICTIEQIYVPRRRRYGYCKLKGEEMCRISVPLLSLITVVYCLAYFGCGSNEKARTAGEQYPSSRSDTLSVDLKAITDAKVVIYQAEPARIIVSYLHFMKNLQDFIDQNNVDDDAILRERVRVMASETDSINIADFTDEPKLIERVRYRLADMLQKGEAMVFQEKTGEKVSHILVEHFEFMVHKMAGRGGRRFYLPDRTLFLEVIDWIS
jgi:hypothetical protein